MNVRLRQCFKSVNSNYRMRAQSGSKAKRHVVCNQQALAVCSRGKQAREKLTQTATSQPEYTIYHNVGYRLFGYWNRIGSEGKKRRSSPETALLVQTRPSPLRRSSPTPGRRADRGTANDDHRPRLPAKDRTEPRSITLHLRDAWICAVPSDHAVTTSRVRPWQKKTPSPRASPDGQNRHKPF